MSGSAFLQQTGYGGGVDQGRSAGSEDDSSLSPSVPLEPSAAGAVHAGLKPGEFGAASGFAKREIEPVPDRLQQRWVKYAPYHWLSLAEGHLNRRRLGAMRDRIALLPLPTGLIEIERVRAGSVQSKGPVNGTITPVPVRNVVP